MKRIILSSHGFAKNPKLMNQIVQSVPADLSRLQVAIITTASAEWKEKNKHAIEAKEAFNTSGFLHTTFVDIEKENPNALLKYDVIYINGGNPFYLLYHLKRSGADKVLKKLAEQGKLIVGVSGGAVVLFSDIQIVQFFDPVSNTIDLRDLTGLGLVDYEIFPHYTTSVENKICDYEKKYNRTVTRLKDTDSVVVSDTD